MISKETRVTRTTEGTCHWPWIDEVIFPHSIMGGNTMSFTGGLHNFIEIAGGKEYPLCEPISHLALVLRKE
jgi:hypothetical protein